MTSLKKRLTATALMLALPCMALAQQGQDAGLGTWKLNVAKSTFKPGPAPVSETRTYATTGDSEQMTSHTVMPGGQALDISTTSKPDGKSYPLSGSPDIDAVRVRRPNSRQTNVEELRGGEVIGHFNRTVSRDGKTLRVTVTTRLRSGVTDHELRVYDRQ